MALVNPVYALMDYGQLSWGPLILGKIFCTNLTSRHSEVDYQGSEAWLHAGLSLLKA